MEPAPKTQMPVPKTDRDEGDEEPDSLDASQRSSDKSAIEVTY